MEIIRATTLGKENTEKIRKEKKKKDIEYKNLKVLLVPKFLIACRRENVAKITKPIEKYAL
jgi:hypothetical protein